MGFFNNVMAKSESVDLEDVLNNMDQIEEESYENADAFVKPMDLIVDADASAVINEAKAGNIVLVNIADLKKRNANKLRELISVIKGEIKKIDGDMAAISQERLLVTPAKVKIIKKK
ncbi:MAG TPA: cell division protein SepF [archaeon]|nr:cell division protein SepF [archaeon]